MKRILAIITVIFLCTNILGCSSGDNNIHIAATTLPVYEFTSVICEGTDIRVDRLINENVSCLHDYSLQVKQMQTIDRADTVIISGAGLEDFLDDVLQDKSKIIVCFFSGIKQSEKPTNKISGTSSKRRMSTATE